MPSLVEYLAHWAKAQPAATAVEHRDHTISYGELHEQSSAVAGSMRERGVGPGDRVAVWARKSIDVVVALYGILKCGAAYVPIDPSAPARRVGRILADCEVSCLVTDGPDAGWALECLSPNAFAYRLTGVRHGAGSGARTVEWEQALRGPRGAGPALPPVPGSDDLAYILYTSGSTGVPKGVMLTHGNACAFTDWAALEFGLAPSDRVSSHAPFYFDLSILDLFATCRAGGCVVLVPESQAGLGFALNKLVFDRNITVWYSVPNALLRMLSAENSAVLAESALRLILFAGEVFPTKHLRRLRQLVPSAELYNLYGPTETNVCTFHRVRDVDVAPGRADAIPIGRPCPYARTFIMDAAGRPIDQRPGAAGELCVAGESVMAGYWRDARLTEQRMALIPRAEAGWLRAYRTGDLVRLDADLNYLFGGRRDAMVKIRGFRVELGEIETVLLGLESIREAACVAAEGPGTEKHIEAYVIPQEDSCDVDQVRKDCVGALPRYMVPEQIHLVDSLPRTATGKIDRRALAGSVRDGVH